jgi:hypothetical protein
LLVTPNVITRKIFVGKVEEYESFVALNGKIKFPFSVCIMAFTPYLLLAYGISFISSKPPSTVFEFIVCTLYFAGNLGLAFLFNKMSKSKPMIETLNNFKKTLEVS